MKISFLRKVVGEGACEFTCTSPQRPPFQEPTSVVGNKVGNEQQLSDWISKEYLDVS